MSNRPTLFCMHFLGGGDRLWTELFAALGPAFRCVAIDLPGFGHAADMGGRDVAGMAAHVADTIRRDGATCWALVGHSMGAKVASLVARAAEDGQAGLGGLTHLVLLAGSPPGPEPIDEARRQTMRDWFSGDPADHRAQARAFVEQNAASPLAPELADRMVDDVLRMDRQAWRDWLDHGHREDWRDHVGTLHTPTLIVAGAEDGDLGAAAQAERVAPHFSAATIAIVADAAHLLPVEQPAEIARLIASHLADLVLPAGMAPDYRALLFSRRVSARTRSVLLARARACEPEPESKPEETCFSDTARVTLRALVARVVPQTTVPPDALARAIETELATGPGDGWRYAALPPDVEAWQAGLAALDRDAPFAAIGPDAQDAILRAAERGQLDGTVMALWFEDVRAACTRAYVAHPATQARISYGGIGYGGDGANKAGFARVGLDAREAWEPVGRAESGS